MNQQTYLTRNWLNGDRDTFYICLEMAQTQEPEELADSIEQLVLGHEPSLMNELFSDLVGEAISSIDFGRLAGEFVQLLHNLMEVKD